MLSRTLLLYTCAMQGPQGKDPLCAAGNHALGPSYLVTAKGRVCADCYLAAYVAPGVGLWVGAAIRDTTARFSGINMQRQTVTA